MGLNEQTDQGGGAQGGELSQTARDILARAGVGGQGADASASSVGGQPTTQQFEVDVGGVKRTVKMEELVGAFTERDKVRQRMEQAEAALAELGDLKAVRALQQQIQSMDPRRRSKVLELMTGGDEDDGADDESLDDVVNTAFGKQGGKQQPARNDSALAERLARLEAATQALAAEANGRFAQQRQATLADSVKQLMGQFPVFRDNPDAAAFAQDSIITQLLHGDAEEPERVVQNAASKLQQLLTSREMRDRERLGVAPTLPQLPKGAGSARGLKDGTIRRLAQQALRQRG